RSIFIGFTPLILAGLALYWQHKKRISTHPQNTAILDPGLRKRAFSSEQITVLYGIITLASYFLTLGPRITLTPTVSIPSPYMLLLPLPGFFSLRVPSRFIVMAIVATAIMGAYALAYLQKKLNPRRARVVFAIIGGCLIIELMPLNANPNYVSADS